MNGKPHPHAELIKQMVDDDTLRATYGDGWHECGSDSVIFYPTRDWRIVQPKPNTITIVANGKEYVLPEPMRDRVIGKEFLGVCWSPSRRAWWAQCGFNGVNHKLGYFSTIEEATEVVRAFRESAHQDHANHGSTHV